MSPSTKQNTNNVQQNSPSFMNETENGPRLGYPSGELAAGVQPEIFLNCLLQELRDTELRTLSVPLPAYSSSSISLLRPSMGLKIR